MHFRIPTPLAVTACAWVASCLCVSARAADDPAPALVATINRVVDLALGQSASAIQAKLPEIRAQMGESFAIDVIVQRSFGRNWSRLSAAQQSEAIDLVGRLVIRTYAMQLRAPQRPQITVTASKDIGADRREIVSTVVHQGDTVNVVYRLGRIDGKWKAYDVLAEGVSVVGNYRQQFDAHFQKGSADGLLGLLRDKLAAIPASKTEGK